jgi:hypothetical protein
VLLGEPREASYVCNEEREDVGVDSPHGSPRGPSLFGHDARFYAQLPARNRVQNELFA